MLEAACYPCGLSSGGAFFIHFTSKRRYLIWNTGSLSRAAGEDTPLFINTACLTEMCCLKGWSRVEECGWTGWGGGTSVSPVSKADSTSSRYIQVTAVVLWDRSVYICGVEGGSLCGWNFSNVWLLWIGIALPLKTMLGCGVNEDVTLGRCLFCISGVKWQPCWVGWKKGQRETLDLPLSSSETVIFIQSQGLLSLMWADPK